MDARSSEDFVWLTDELGNAYLISREVAEAARIPAEHKEAVQKTITADVQGYDLSSLAQAWNAWRAISQAGTFGSQSGDKAYNAAADIDGDGFIDGYDKAAILEALADFSGKKVNYQTPFGANPVN